MRSNQTIFQKTKRYRITGNLILKTALHIGGSGMPARGTDSPILRDGYERPYIPGSSLKGALRAAVERILPSLNGHTACSLFVPIKSSSEDEQLHALMNAQCLTPLPENHQKKKAFRKLEESLGEEIQRSKNLQKAVEMLLGEQAGKIDISQAVAEAHLLMALEKNLCDVCKAFGSPFMASSIYFHDAPVVEDRWIGLTQVRDGVGIDRDSGRAKERIKYDYEIVPPDTAFEFSMTIETGNEKALGLAALALHELTQGNIPIGGIRSRGLGRCGLEDGRVEFIDFKDLSAYLLEGKWQEMSLEQFIQTHIKVLIQD